MNARELKKIFVDFFVSKGHVEILSASLIPENDSTTLFTSAGMQPLIPFLLGLPHSQGKRLVNVQKSLRTDDIEEVGDNCHHTFFEMLGNWSLGDYFKETMIPWSYEFLTKHLHYKPEQIHVTCFAGDKDAPKDMESHDLWRSVGIPEDRINFLPKKDNWWGPIGAAGPCGPDSEMFIDTHPELGPIQLTSGDNRGRIIEIGNDVFMQYNKDTKGKYVLLSQKNVDTGYGVERNLAIYFGYDDDYMTDIWQPIIKKIEEISNQNYPNETCSDSDNGKNYTYEGIVDYVLDGNELSSTDECERNYVIEYFCSNDDYTDFTKQSCGSTKICSNGRCVPLSDDQIDIEQNTTTECTNGESNCDGSYYIYCANGQWLDAQRIPGQCGFQTNTSGNNLQGRLGNAGSSTEQGSKGLFYILIFLIILVIIGIVAAIIYHLIKNKNKKQNPRSPPPSTQHIPPRPPFPPRPQFLQNRAPNYSGIPSNIQKPGNN